MEIRAQDAARLYQAVRPATEHSPGDDTQNAPSVAKFTSNFVRSLQEAEATAQDAMLGKADPQALVQALAQTELAVEAAVTLRNKVVEAYQEILRMPV